MRSDCITPNAMIRLLDLWRPWTVDDRRRWCTPIRYPLRKGTICEENEEASYQFGRGAGVDACGRHGLCAKGASLSTRAAAVTPHVVPTDREERTVTPDAAKTYSLAELINLAEQNNPETRVAWQNAKARAADLGISKASLYPTVGGRWLSHRVRAIISFCPQLFSADR